MIPNYGSSLTALNGSFASPALFIPFLLFIVMSLLWSALLNHIAVCFATDRPLTESNRCTAGSHPPAWYERIRSSCRYCHASFSLWYPLVTLVIIGWSVSLLILTTRVLEQNPPLSTFGFLSLFLFGSAMCITMRTDGEHFIILRLCTIGIMPIGLLAAWTGSLPITLIESIAGIASGAAILALTRWTFRTWRGYEGLGEGDVELLSAIGSFVGPLGIWQVLMLASVSALCYALVRIALHKATYQSHIPFGLFLAGAGCLTALLQASGFLMLNTSLLLS